MATDQAPFSLPPDGEVFTNDILERAEELINAGIWEGLDGVRVRTWMQNFETAEEQYFAACVLDALIYRPNSQTVAMMEQMLERVLPDLTRLDPPPRGVVDWSEALRASSKEGDHRIRIVPVIRDNDPPTKSGPLMARIYRRRLRVNDHWMIWPWQLREAIEKGVKTVLFIDDFLGAGTQFVSFTQVFKIGEILKDVYAVYAPLVAHSQGIKHIRDHLSAVKVCAVEILESRYGLFAPDSMYFHDGKNSPSCAKRFYEDLIKRRLPDVEERYREGWGKLQLAYAFEHAVPNNCLPILWHQTVKWNPLFER